ncbi:MAG TPA: tetratricopeptide repeat protein [Symbiobacteriaceae bacterium]|jgi:predicted ATPase/DNA-binding CsgD family transcriptional regulator/Tfp pilus assembly protein PilF
MLLNQTIGTVTFLTAETADNGTLSEQDSGVLAEAVAYCDSLLTSGVEQNGGRVLGKYNEGGTTVAMFVGAGGALAAAVSIQSAILAGPVHLRFRMALHTGDVGQHDTAVHSAALNRCLSLLRAAHGGQILLSLVTVELVRDSLPPGVGLRALGRYRLQDLARREEIFQLVHPNLPANFLPLRSLDLLPNNLPVQLASFVGREREMADLKRLLDKARLVTLTGTGGCGKTRLSLQVAGDVSGDYLDGVWLVELAAIMDPARVEHAVASVLGVREESGRSPLAALTDHLRAKHLLLVLDNCEHLIGACALLADTLLRECPGLRILATSREALRIDGEVVWRVPGLSLPSLKPLTSVADLMKYEGVCLFLERAKTADPTFSLDPRNAAAVVQVCHRLDGMPLALELAAARLNVLSVETIAQRLDDRFRLLTGGSRTAIPRHQRLSAAVDWSYELLAEPERTMWHRLSVFAGSFSLAAVEAICSEDHTPSADLLELMFALVNKSLVMVDESHGEVRYRLLETIRQYGEDRLMESGEEVHWRQQHLHWYLALAERTQQELGGPGQSAALEQLEQEHDNLAAAMRWAVESGEAEMGLRLAMALFRFWSVRGHVSEGRRWLAQMLSGAPARTAPRVQALIRAGSLAWEQGDYDEAGALCQEALGIARELGDERVSAEMLDTLGAVALEQGDTERALALFEESQTRWRDLDDQGSLASTLNNLATLLGRQGEYSRAVTLFDEALSLGLRLGDRQQVAWVLNNLGFMLIDRDDHERARALLEEALTISRQLGDKRGVARSLQGRGTLAGLQGDFTEATALLQEGLSLDWGLMNKRAMVTAIESLARFSGAQGQMEQAARLFGTADHVRDRMGLKELPVSLRRRADQIEALNTVRSALGQAVFAKIYAEGHAMTLEQVIQYALQTPTPSDRSPDGDPGNGGVLSARELEIARLVARGFTAREIARQLHLSHHTVKKHEENVRSKLNVPNKAGMAAWVARNDLARGS